ncbi:MAG: cytochrome c oxidase subunit 3 [Candidatus Acidiferrum sp.]
MSESEIALTAGGHADVMEAPAYAVSPKKLTMWLFIISDSVTFGSVLFAYGFLRVGSTNWSTPFKSASILNGAIMTVILLTSSLTMLGAVIAAKAGRKSSSIKWMGLTVLLGVLFAALHIREWLHMIGEGWRLFQNPTGGSVEFGAAFFCITGLHLLHVTCGVIAIIVVAMGYKRGWLTEGHVETTGLYWHFVDVVWMFVFPLVYLMNAAR